MNNKTDNTRSLLTQKHIDDSIHSMESGKVGKKTTIVCITLKNGFEVVGSAICVDAASYDQKIGEEIAIANATRKIYELLGFDLQMQNYYSSTADADKEKDAAKLADADKEKDAAKLADADKEYPVQCKDGGCSRIDTVKEN